MKLPKKLRLTRLITAIVLLTSCLISNAATPQRHLDLLTNLINSSSERIARTRTQHLDMVVADIGPHHRLWVNSVTNGSTRSGNHRVMEVASGMNYYDGGWKPAVATFSPTATGDAFIADKILHKTRLAANLNSVAAISITTPEPSSRVLQSTPVAIVLVDPATGVSTPLASVADSTATLVNSNKVLYPDAFRQNGICASVLVTISRGAISHDIIITGYFDPTEYGFPADSQLQIFWELYGDPPAPQEIQRVLRPAATRRPALVDNLLGFGELVYANGRAYLSTAASPNSGAAIPVVKKFTINPDGRRFLIESIELAPVLDKLKSLPRCSQTSASLAPRPDYKLAQARSLRIPNVTEPAETAEHPATISGNGTKLKVRLTAQNASVPEGFVIDPVASVGGLNYTNVFQSDYTYFVSGPLYCNSAVVIEPTVFKFPHATGPYATASYIQLNNGATFKTSLYYPAVFTSGDDENCGESVQGFMPHWQGEIQPNTYYGSTAIFVNCQNIAINNVRIRYAQEAIRIDGTAALGAWPYVISHSQFLSNRVGLTFSGALPTYVPPPPGGDDQSGVQRQGPSLLARIFEFLGGVAMCTAPPGGGTYIGGANYQAKLNNCLLVTNLYPINITAIAHPYFYNCTIDNGPVSDSGPLVTSTVPSAMGQPSAVFVNSIFANIATKSSGTVNISGNCNGFYNSFGGVTFGTNYRLGPTPPASPFIASGLGSHYLAQASSFRATGTISGLDNSLLNDLTNRTTTAPIFFPTFMYFTGDVTLFPQIPRYTSGNPNPDLGYYFDALDVTIAAAVSDGNLTALPGTAIGFRNDLVTVHGTQIPTVWGLGMFAGSSFISHGTPNSPVTIVPVGYVQEAPPPIEYMQSFDPYFLQNTDNLPPPSLDFRFSNLYLPHQYQCQHIASGHDAFEDYDWSEDSAMTLIIRDSNVRGGAITLGKPYYSVWYAAGSAAWDNSLFDRTDVTLDPDLADYGDPTPHVTLTFAAHNNLFRGGRLRIEPIPSSPVWEFTDNLFDKAVFEQDVYSMNLPLNHDYNGYWPRLEAEKYSWQAARLSPNAANDVVLTTTPLYQSNTFGDRYLSSTTPTLVNVGSRSPADAQLYHFTTNPLQNKDSTQAKVTIGLHYVAAGPDGKPMDSDVNGSGAPAPDGIPDYVENWHGDGRYDWHTDTETDWLHNYSTLGEDGVTPVEDKRSLIYDDVDLDGDGMVGRLESVLGLDPLSADNPFRLMPAGSTDTAYQFTFDAPPALDSSLWKPHLAVDIQSSLGGWALQNLGAGHYQVSVMKHSFAPGQHLLQLMLGEAANQPNRSSQSSLALTAPGPIVSLNNDSLFWTDPLANIFGTMLLVQAGLDPGASDYVVRVYDQSQNLLTSWSSPNDTGYIYSQVDLSALSGGQSYAGDYAYVEIEAHPSNPAKATERERLKNVRGRTYSNNTLEFAYGWNENPGSSGGRKRNNMYLNGVINVLFNPSGNNPYSPTALPSAYTVPPFAMAYPGDQAYLKLDMLNPGINNFFFSGHGSDQTFGSTASRVGADGYSIFYATEIEAMYNNILGNGRWDSLGRAFRLVILNTCYSAKSDQFAIAFGISPSLTSLADFQQRGLPVQAFVGWTSGWDLPKGYFGDYDGYQEALSMFTTMWMDEAPLDLCLWWATGSSILQNMRYPMDPTYRIIGYRKMTRSGP